MQHRELQERVRNLRSQKRSAKEQVESILNERKSEYVVDLTHPFLPAAVGNN